MQESEASEAEFVPGPCALDLPAGGSGHAHRSDDDDVDGQPQFVGQALPDERREVRRSAAVEVERTDFLYQNDVFAA
ncbi:hypothetical protein GCM10010365_56460 [Streptomyces poonensis]|uniref:Uncharacterized protein n=1 Tax=Streptomyces poonensis TaxID=68255 RepID=A0A918URT0_9ACTN|nr:hypothetical protein GCM10010365_56460 [Streptomyces poonensis]